MPLEQFYQFHDFHSPLLDDPDFDAKPMILLVGQYSTGKTTFIKYLLEREFPGIRIGPEPTTDRFIAVMYDEKEGVIPGNALVVDPNKQFRPLSKFGNAFLNRFQCSTVASPVLKGISIVDTPGILSGEKQRVNVLFRLHPESSLPPQPCHFSHQLFHSFSFVLLPPPPLHDLSITPSFLIWDSSLFLHLIPFIIL